MQLFMLALLCVLLGESAARQYVLRGPVVIIESADETFLNGATPSKAAVHARQLVHDNEWTTMATVSVQFKGVPWANVVSYSDGIGNSAEASTGELYFYLTTLDSTGTDLAANPSASIAISLAQQGRSKCKMDVEDPTCWKLSMSGKVVPVPKDKEDFAKKALFSKHPQMEYWPSDHGFRAYMLNIENIVLLDYYGGAKHIPVDEYYGVKL